VLGTLGAVKPPVRFSCRVDGHLVEMLRVVSGNAWRCDCAEYGALHGCVHVIRAATAWTRRKATITDGITQARRFTT